MVEESCGEELALDTGDAQNCRMSTGCFKKLSKDDQTRSSVSKPELRQAQYTCPFVYLLACWPASSDLGRSGFVSKCTVCRGAQRERHTIDKRSGQM